MMTAVGGPSMWHYLHIMSFNYPVSPSSAERRHYRCFMRSLVNVLPCGKCRDNLKNNYKQLPLRDSDMASRAAFSRYVYRLHELVNSMLGKASGLSYCDVRERYEHFRARCSHDHHPTTEQGCTVPKTGRKAKAVIKIVPQEHKCESLEISKRCFSSPKSKAKR